MDTFASIQFVEEEAPRSSSIGKEGREVPFDHFKSTFINHMKIVEEESQRFPGQVAEMLITIENMPPRSLSVQRLAEETFEDALNNTTNASESPFSPQ